jgi:F-box-like
MSNTFDMVQNGVNIINSGRELPEAELLLRSSAQEQSQHSIQLRGSIASLPPEVLIAVFRACPYNPWEHGEHAMRVSQVSHHWRDIAINTPSLWSSIRIHIPSAGPGQLKLMELFIERSRTSPLDIVIDLTRPWNHHEYIGSPFRPLDMILLFVPLWRSLFISGNISEDVVNVCTCLGHLHAPLLESFEVVIEADVDDGHRFDAHLPIFEGGAPKLRHVKVQGIPLTSCQPPLSSIFSLHLCISPEPMEIVQYCDALTSSQCLSDLHLVGDVVEDISVDHTLPGSLLISAMSLRSLKISAVEASALYNLLMSLESPALECLTIVCFPRMPHIPALAEVLRRTDKYPLLKSLSLQSAYFNQPGTNDIVSNLPSVTFLSIRSCNSPATLLHLLLRDPPHSAEAVNWPLLQIIAISPVGSEELDALDTLIQNRILCDFPITCVQFDPHGFRTIPSKRLQWLQERVRVEIRRPQ